MLTYLSVPFLSFNFSFVFMFQSDVINKFGFFLFVDILKYFNRIFKILDQQFLTFLNLPIFTLNIVFKLIDSSLLVEFKLLDYPHPVIIEIECLLLVFSRHRELFKSFYFYFHFLESSCNLFFLFLYIFHMNFDHLEFGI